MSVERCPQQASPDSGAKRGDHAAPAFSGEVATFGLRQAHGNS
ncbi:hypothetical protein [Arthrobacter psychrolactophilus]